MDLCVCCTRVRIIPTCSESGPEVRLYMALRHQGTATLKVEQLEVGTTVCLHTGLNMPQEATKEAIVINMANKYQRVDPRLHH